MHLSISWLAMNAVLGALGGTFALSSEHEAFFILRPPAEAAPDARVYGRNAWLHIDDEGRVADANGAVLQTVAAPFTKESTFDARLANEVLHATRPTETINWRGNLDPYAPSLAFDPNRPEATSGLHHRLQLYDGLGQPHPLWVYFNSHEGLTDGAVVKGVTYQWHAMMYADEWVPTPDPNATSSDPNTLNPNTQAHASMWRGAVRPRAVVMQGALIFNPTGALQAVTFNQATLRFTNGAPEQSLTMFFGHTVSRKHTGRDGMTAFTNQSRLDQVQQDGYAVRDIVSASAVDANGMVTLKLSDKSTLSLGPIAMARFYDAHALQARGDVYVPTQASGRPQVSVADCRYVVTAQTDSVSAKNQHEDCPADAATWSVVHSGNDLYTVLEGNYLGVPGRFYAKDITLAKAYGQPVREAFSQLAVLAYDSVEGTTSTTAAPLTLPEPKDIVSPRATTRIKVVGNLDVAQPVAAIDAYHLQESATVSAHADVYDEDGQRHTLRFDFYAQGTMVEARNAVAKYIWLASFDPVADGRREIEDIVADGVLTFMATAPGGLFKATMPTLTLPLSRDPNLNTQSVSFGQRIAAWNPKNSACPKRPADGGIPADFGTDGLVVQLRAPHIRAVIQDGYGPTVEQTQLLIDACGLVSATFAEQQTALLGRLAVAHIPDSTKLRALNDWLYVMAPGSTEPELAVAECGDLNTEVLRPF